jgi:hypothetical protein
MAALDSTQNARLPEVDGYSDEDDFYDNTECMLLDCDIDDGVEGKVQDAASAERSNIPINPNSVKHVYRDETWTQFTNEYAPGTLPFTGDPLGVKKSYPRMPSFLHLFGLFWIRNMLRSICIETNRYARVVEDGRNKSGHDWYDMDEKELRTFLAVSLYMVMKKQPNVKSYWAKSEKLFYCPVIANLLSQRHFLALRKCLHLTNTSDFGMDTTSPQYDKMGQCCWLINSIRDACRKVWNVAKMCTVDEMMVRYKGKYCPAP